MSEYEYTSFESQLNPAHPEALPLATVGMRFLGWVLESFLVVITLVIGWLIWYFVVVGRGLTPARQMLKLIVVDSQTKVPVDPGKAFIRGFLVYVVLFGIILSVIPFGALIAAAFIFRESRQTLWDQLTNTVIGQGR
jgi:hypothetical protein